MRTRASGRPSSAASMLRRCPSSPTPGSISEGTRPSRRYVLFPVGPVQGEALLAWRSIGSALKVILQSNVHEIAVGKRADQVLSLAGKPADGSFEREIVPKVCNADGAQKRVRLVRCIHGKCSQP